MTAAAALPTDKTIDFNSGTFENEPDVQSECGTTTSLFAGQHGKSLKCGTITRKSGHLVTLTYTVLL